MITAKTVCARLPEVAKNGLHQLHEIFNLSPRSTTTPSAPGFLLVAIDFENIHTINSGFSTDPNCEAGIAILDPEMIKETPSDKLLRTYHLTTGTPLYVEKASNRFRFGKTLPVSSSELANCIQTLIPRDRRVVFVGHGVMNDL
jgi:hypothetical protein